MPELGSLRKFIAEEDLWPVNWKVFTRRGLHSDRLRKWTGEPASLEQMIAASQDYQAFVLKYHTEFFRRHKFAPCNGALFFQFRDCWPAVTASVVDYYGKEIIINIGSTSLLQFPGKINEWTNRLAYNGKTRSMRIMVLVASPRRSV